MGTLKWGTRYFYRESRCKHILQISQPPIGDHERHMQFLIRERMRGMQTPNTIRSRGALLLELARELRDLRDELEERRYGNLKIFYHLFAEFQTEKSVQNSFCLY